MMGPHPQTAAAPLPAHPGAASPAFRQFADKVLSDHKPASVTNVTCIGALDDTFGRHVAVLQDHDGVRIDVGGIEIMLTRAASRELRSALLDAEVESCLWEDDNA